MREIVVYLNCEPNGIIICPQQFLFLFFLLFLAASDAFVRSD